MKDYLLLLRDLAFWLVVVAFGVGVGAVIGVGLYAFSTLFR